MKVLSFFSLLLLIGCTVTKLTSSWIAPSAGAVNYKKIMVVSMNQKDSMLRKKMEQHMVDDLKAIGYDAVAFTKEFSISEFRNIRYDSVRKKLSQKNIDGVITINLMAKDEEDIYVKDKGYVNTEAVPLGGFWSSPPATVKQDIGKPGYYVTSVQYYWESSFYDVNSIALLYNAKSTAFEVSSANSLAHKYGKLIVTDMQKNYLLSAKN